MGSGVKSLWGHPHPVQNPDPRLGESDLGEALLKIIQTNDLNSSFGDEHEHSNEEAPLNKDSNSRLNS